MLRVQMRLCMRACGAYTRQEDLALKLSALYKASLPRVRERERGEGGGRERCGQTHGGGGEADRWRGNDTCTGRGRVYPPVLRAGAPARPRVCARACFCASHACALRVARVRTCGCWSGHPSPPPPPGGLPRRICWPVCVCVCARATVRSCAHVIRGTRGTWQVPVTGAGLGSGPVTATPPTLAVLTSWHGTPLTGICIAGCGGRHDRCWTRTGAARSASPSCSRGFERCAWTAMAALRLA